ELRDVLQVRRGLEVEGTRLAAANRTEADLAELTALLARRDQCQAAGDTDEFARADAEFHLAVVRSSHNLMLTELYRGLIEAITASVATTHEKPVEIVDHAVLLEHIAAGDVERAAGTAAALLDGILAALDASS
ncbi:MAG: FCD domain-containing protein, partial [Mycobacterium sp.]